MRSRIIEHCLWWASVGQVRVAANYESEIQGRKFQKLRRHLNIRVP